LFVRGHSSLWVCLKPKDISAGLLVSGQGTGNRWDQIGQNRSQVIEKEAERLYPEWMLALGEKQNTNGTNSRVSPELPRARRMKVAETGYL
jgi:hypothetical protein